MVDQQPPAHGSGQLETRAKAHRPTMADVAERAGVSRTLVSLIFRNLPGASAATRQRVLRAADQLGYRPDSAARLLARGRSRTVGVIMNVHQPFEADLVTEMFPEAERLGYDLLLSPSAPARDERKAIEALLSHRCEALILLGPSTDAENLRELVEGTVAVVVGRRSTDARADCVHTAESTGMGQAVDHLVELGHRRIVHVDGGNDPGSAERRLGYLDAMRRHDLGNETRVIPGAHNEEAGIAAGQTLLGEDSLPTAVLAASDLCAMGLMDALRRGGVEIPRDLSLVGYDDAYLSHLAHIDLTTIRQDSRRIAEHAVHSAIKRLEDPEVTVQEIVVDPKLVVRGTTGPPPPGR